MNTEIVKWDSTEKRIYERGLKGARERERDTRIRLKKFFFFSNLSASFFDCFSRESKYTHIDRLYVHCHDISRFKYICVLFFLHHKRLMKQKKTKINPWF